MDLDETPARLKLKSIAFDRIKQVASQNVHSASSPPNEVVIFSGIGHAYSRFAARKIAPRASDGDASLTRKKVLGVSFDLAPLLLKSIYN
jgi:hypothetical protein